MDYEAALNYMQGLVRFGWKLGNERFTELCARLGDPQNQYRIVHVAGTKGKGSTTALASAILEESGLRVGSYYSPYVYDVRERVQVDGELISPAEFAELVTRARSHIEALAGTDLGQVTEFELKTLVGFLQFAQKHVDCACIEVGIGGRLDATNIVRPAVTVITNIGLDHTQILGDTHELIAAEKAGIIKPAVPCITAVDHPGALQVIRSIAEERSSPLIRVSRGSTEGPAAQPGEIRWDLDAPTAGTAAVPTLPTRSGPFHIATSRRVYHVPEMAMRGLHQRINAACAVGAAEELLLSIPNQAALSEEAVQRAMARTSLPGRLTTIQLSDHRLIVMDGAHNELAARSIRGPLDELIKEYDIRRTIVVLGMLAGHDAHAVANVLLAGAERVFVCSPQWKRAVPAEELAVGIRGLVLSEAITVVPHVRDAVEAAVGESRHGDMVLITGSFYTVGEADLNWIRSLDGGA